MSNALEINSFAASVMHLKLKRECKEDYLEVRESKVGIGLKAS